MLRRGSILWLLLCLAVSGRVDATSESLQTAWGAPDLQGIWDLRTATPLERPKRFAGRQFMSEEEAIELERISRLGQVPGHTFTLEPALWWDFGGGLTEGRRTSLVVDPENGRIPALTWPARIRQRLRWRRYQLARAAEDRSLSERCVQWMSTPLRQVSVNNFVQLFQTADHVVIYHEMIHDVRIIPLDGRPHLSETVRQLRGDSRGWWDRDTLVVETTNFNDDYEFAGAGRQVRLVERFTRLDERRLRYRYTVEDPESFRRPWTVELTMQRSDGPLYEFACHEGNRSLAGILRAARAKDDSLGARVWLLWVLAHVVAFALIRALGDGRAVLPLSSRVRTLVRAALVGLFLAAMQWFVLQKAVSWAGSWAVAGFVGYAIGFCVGEAFESIVGRRAVGQFLFGAVVGMAQGLVLEWYADSSAVLWIAASSICLGGTDTALKYLIRRRGLPVRASVALLGVVIGGGTGAVLVWQL